MKPTQLTLKITASFAIIMICLLCLAGKGFAQISSTNVVVQDSSSTTGATTSATPTSYCTGGSSDLSISGGHLGTGASWKWYEDACPSGVATSIGTGASITVNPVNTGAATITKTYYVRAEGTCNTTACKPVTITIYPTPAVQPPANATYCNNTPVAASPLSGTPTGITYDISGGNDIGLPDAINQTQVPGFTAGITGTSPVTRTITITPKANGCTGTPVTFTITVLPTATMTAIANQVKCDSTMTDAVTFSTTATGGTVTYSWTNDHPEIGLAASGSGTGIPSFNIRNTTCADVVATIQVTPTFSDGANNCTGTPTTFTYTIHPRPNGTVQGNGPICQGDPATVTFDATCGTGPFDIIIKQDGINHTYDDQADGAIITVTPQPTTQGTHTYDLMKITDANGCVRGEE